MYAVHGFDQAKLNELNVSHDAALILRWFVDYSGTEHIRTILIGGVIWKYVNLNVVVEDLPILRASTQTIRRRLTELVTAGILDKTVISDGQQITCYKLDDAGFIPLIDRGEGKEVVTQQEDTDVQGDLFQNCKGSINFDKGITNLKGVDQNCKGSQEKEAVSPENESFQPLPEIKNPPVYNINSPLPQIPTDNQEVSINTGKTPKTRFVKPGRDEVKAYCQERNRGVDPDAWYDHYEANGWKVSKVPMHDWKAAIRTWEHNVKRFTPRQGPKINQSDLGSHDVWADYTGGGK